jgi:CBS domain-containing protein
MLPQINIEVKDYFIKLGKKTTAALENWFEFCPNGHMGAICFGVNH